MSDRPNPMEWLNEPTPDGVFVGEGDDGLHLLGLPQGVNPRTRRQALDRLQQSKLSQATLDCLNAMIHALRECGRFGSSRRIEMDALSSQDQAFVLDLLGQGEASVQIARSEQIIQAQESVFPGLWIVRAEANPAHVWIEVADVPSDVRAAMDAMPERTLPLEVIVPPDGTMNVMGVLAEVRHIAGAWRKGQANHVMNFTLLPMTEPDVDFLAQMLGQGPVHIVSGGYGAARIIATAFPRVWAVQYINSMGVVILDTLEIGDVPIAARAGMEDFCDSAVRLAHILTGELQ